MSGMSRQEFFESRNGVALTYDDATLQMGMSSHSPQEVDVTGRFTKRIELSTPFASAAMDTVTTAPMAIAMAKMGGIGVIHAGLEPEEQFREVRRVKLSLNGLIEKPICVTHGQTLRAVLGNNEKKGYTFHTFPVVDSGGKLVGLMTQNDFEMHDERHRVSTAMTRLEDVVTASEDTTPQQAYKIMMASKKKTLPLINKHGEPAGMYVWSDVERVVSQNPDGYSIDSEGRLLTAAAVPTDESGIERVRLMYPYLDVVVLDSAQGDSKYAFSTLEALHNMRDEFPNLDIMVGNVTDGLSALALVDAGADGIKVGQGPGSICSTRRETGGGTPQLTALYECASALEGTGIPICADGGIVNHGDVVKALAAGADSVMMGSALAGTDEAPGVIIMHEGKPYMLYRGMGSESALRDSAASRKRYGGDSRRKPRPEGVEALKPYIGPVSGVVEAYRDLLAKGMSYFGLESISKLHSHSRWWQITPAGKQEAHPHDVMIIAPGQVNSSGR